MGEFTNKVAVVTGGSSGIGFAIAEKLHKEGAKLAIVGRDKKKLDESISHFKSAIAIQADISKVADIERLYKETKEKLGNIDLLVANAGVARLKHVKDVDEAFFDEMVDINYKGLYFTIQKAIPYLNPKASIVLISSVAGHITFPEHSVYSSTKAAVSYLAKSFALDLVERGIRVNAISPGFIDTPIFDDLKKAAPEKIDLYKEIVPVKRFGTTGEIADAALFLLSPKSSYMTGSDLVIDGGLRLSFPTRN